MKSLLAFLGFFVVLIVAAASLAWFQRANLAAYLISNQLHVPVSIQSLDIASGQASVSNFWMGNPPNSKTHTSFSSQALDIDTTFRELTGDILTIDQVDLSNIFVGIELYGPNDSNWSHIAKRNESQKKGRDYLIRTLVLNNLTVQVTQPDGSARTYPTIAHMEFHNITSETGFPISEIEKAIFNLVIQDLFQRFNLNQLIETLNPLPAATPVLKLIPGLF